jgi:hypothetical protein
MLSPWSDEVAVKVEDGNGNGNGNGKEHMYDGEAKVDWKCTVAPLKAIPEVAQDE